MDHEEVDQLVRKITGVEIGAGTDRPSCFEGYDGRDGVLQIREHILDEDDIITGEIEDSEGSLSDVLDGAVSEGGNFGYIDLEGLTPAEAAAVLNDSRYVVDAAEIAGADGELTINGIAYEFRCEVLVEYDS